ncbi:Hpt domain-containing protein, partial [bacterium]|nr:Hpt domain-containing protein [bacterium]
KEKNVVREIYTKPETFRTLLHLLNEISLDIKSMNSQMRDNSISQEDLRYRLGNLHSLKGTSYFLNLDELGKAAHQMETLIVRLKENSASPNLLMIEYEKKREALEHHMNYVNSILEGMSDETRKRLTAELILSKEETANLESTLKTQPKALSILLKAKKVSSQRLVEGWKEELERICQNLPKRIVFRNIGEPISLPGDLFSKLKAPMIHLLRNCAEHGIESINERKKNKKPSAGLISFSAEYANGQYALHVQDNGRGVSKIHVISKAEEVIKKGSDLSPTIERLLNENKILAILFLPGFSTKEKTTELSGRGVGLDVVQRAVSEAGGKIFMKTVPGKGTKFTMTFPGVP